MNLEGSTVEHYTMRSNISLLIGSGFSIPEGLPGVKQLNERLSKIDESEILIHSDQSAGFLNGQVDVNERFGRIERKFLQEFLEHYNQHVLTDGETFHYETFYDFYSVYLVHGDNSESIEGFYKEFNTRHLQGEDGGYDCLNRMSNFNRSFNQLLASQLHKARYFEDVSFTGHHYGPFIRFLVKAMETHDVKFHTLNHDLFFDHLGRHHSDLWQKFCDGFEIGGSPFYGKVSCDYKTEIGRLHKEYLVKLPRFTDRYDKPLAMFKLHGSIMTKIVHVQEPEPTRVRIKSDYAVGTYQIEVTDSQSGDKVFKRLFDDVAPDFLSGTTNKTRYYTDDPYYVRLLEHFKNNLSSSDLLVVIGYGFQDPGINDYLEENYLSSGKKMIVIDPYRPNCELLDKYETNHIPKGVIDLSFEEYTALLNDE